MKKTTSLCFSSKGLLNPESISYLQEKEMDAIIVFGDGSQEAFEHMRDFDYASLGNVQQIGVGKTPMYDMRVVHPDGTVSKPNYAYSEDIRMKWICSKIVTKHIELSISDITSKNSTEVKLDDNEAEWICYMAYRLWSMLLVAEERLCFPAIVIDRMTRWTFSLTPQTIDIALLRKEMGLSTLEYNPLTDLLAITVAGDIFSVKLSVLNEFYGKHILPLFNLIYGRRMRIRVAITGATGQPSEPVDMSYGQLGSVIDGMKSYAKEQLITADAPMDPQDFLAFAKKVKINDESCLWPIGTQSIKDLITTSHKDIVRGVDDDYDTGEDTADTVVEQPDPIHA